MSRTPIARNPDLTRLDDEGYALEIHLQGYLLVRNVPYVNSAQEVKRGTLVGTLKTRGSLDDIVHFNDHTVQFIGEAPCDHTGSVLAKLIIDSSPHQLCPDLVVNHRFSQKPGPDGYPSIYAQIKQYVAILESQAQYLDPLVTAKTGPIVTKDPEQDSPFVYTDTASTRAQIVMVTEKLRKLKIAIVGVGGTGSYVLDQVSKTPVSQIALFDDDVFYTHNAFRGPGAATVQQLREEPLKVDYWKQRYEQMHRGITAHAYRVNAAKAEELTGFDYVFLCMDSGPDKLAIIEALERADVTFIDAGIGMQEVDGALRGTVRVTTSTPLQRSHVRERVSFAAPMAGDDYEQNIQVADLNALNAVLAVIKWKKLCGFYHDFAHEHDTSYTVNSHSLTKDVERDEGE